MRCSAFHRSQVSQLTQALASRDQQAEEAAALLRKVAEVSRDGWLAGKAGARCCNACGGPALTAARRRPAQPLPPTRAQAKNLAVAAGEAAKAVHAEQLRRLNGLLEQANARAGALEAEAEGLRPDAARAAALEQRNAELVRQLGEARAALERARAGEAAAHQAAADAAAALQRKASEVRRGLAGMDAGSCMRSWAVCSQDCISLRCAPGLLTSALPPTACRRPAHPACSARRTSRRA